MPDFKTTPFIIVELDLSNLPLEFSYRAQLISDSVVPLSLTYRKVGPRGFSLSGDFVLMVECHASAQNRNRKRLHTE